MKSFRYPRAPNGGVLYNVYSSRVIVLFEAMKTTTHLESWTSSVPSTSTINALRRKHH